MDRRLESILTGIRVNQKRNNVFLGLQSTHHYRTGRAQWPDILLLLLCHILFGSGDVLQRRALQHEAPAACFLGRDEYLPLSRKSSPRPVLSACPRRPIRRKDPHGHLCSYFLHLFQQPRRGNTFIPFFVVGFGRRGRFVVDGAAVKYV